MWLKEKGSQKCGELDERITEAFSLVSIEFLAEVFLFAREGHDRLPPSI